MYAVGTNAGALVKIENASQLYVAAPMGYVRDDAFVNAVIRGTTTLKPLELLEMMQAIEAAMGRRSGVQFGPRPIDLDLLFYEAVQMETRKLTVPHPRIAQRAFVLKPLAEIAPALLVEPDGFLEFQKGFGMERVPHFASRRSTARPARAGYWRFP